MEKTEGNEYAFPVAASYTDENPGVLVSTGGLTKREYFAAMAMQGLCACKVSDPKFLAGAAVEYADALINELNKPQQP